MPIALSREDFAALAAKNPGLKPDALLKLAALHNDIRLGSLRDTVAKGWDKTNTPLDGNALTKAAQGVSPKLQADLNDSPTWAAIKGFGAGALEGAAGVADSFTSPMGLAGLLLGAGEGVAGAKGLAGLAKAAKAGNTALNVGNAAGAIAKASGPNAGMQDYLTAALSTLPALAGKGGKAAGHGLATSPAVARFIADEEGALKMRPGLLAKGLRTTPEPGRYATRLPVARQLANYYERGKALPHQSTWDRNIDALLEGFNGQADDALTFNRVWGATSPGTSAVRNTQEAASVQVHKLLSGGQALSEEAAQTLPWGKITMAPSKVPNINRALRGEPLSGDKVEAMAQYMLGNPRLPMDVHTIYGMGGQTDKLSLELPALRQFFLSSEGLKRGGLTDTDVYKRTERALADTLEGIDPGVKLVPKFATMWEGIRDAKGLQPQGGPVDMLRAKGLLERGAMLDPDRIRAALASGSWSIRKGRP